MQNLIRRSSGVYVFRLSVPRRLRHVIGKREVIVSTGTRELSVAKIVAASLASQWLQQFFESDRLLSATNTSTMPHDDLLKIAHGHPTLLTGSTLKMTHAASAAGLTTRDLLQAAADGKLELFIRAVQLPGYQSCLDQLHHRPTCIGGIGIASIGQLAHRSQCCHQLAGIDLGLDMTGDALDDRQHRRIRLRQCQPKQLGRINVEDLGQIQN